MRFVGLSGVAVMALTVSAKAQEVERWQPADCASLEANSLEAAVLKCDPANLLGSTHTGSAAAASERAASWPDPTDEDLILDPPISDEKPSAMTISSSIS